MTKDHIYSWQDGARLARGQYDNTYLDELRGRQEALRPCYNQSGALRQRMAWHQEVRDMQPDTLHWTTRESKQAVKEGDGFMAAFNKGGAWEPYHYEDQTEFDRVRYSKDSWVDVPFWFAWLVWSVPIVVLTNVVVATNAPRAGNKYVLIANLLAIFASLLVTTVTKLGHEYLGWFGGVAKGRVVKCDSSYQDDEHVIKRDPPGYRPVRTFNNYDIVVSSDAHKKCIEYFNTDTMQAYEKCVIDEYWREQDARNGLHRDTPISSSIGDGLPTPIKRWAGLHHFTLSIGFRHEEE